MASNVIGAFSREAVEEFSRSKGEPEWMREKRLQAWDVYEAMPAPLGRRGDLGTLRAFSNFSFQQLTPSGTGRGEQRHPQGAPRDEGGREQRHPQGAPRDRTWEEQRHPQGAPNHIRPTPASTMNDEGALPGAIAQSLREGLVDQRAGLIVQRNGSVIRTELNEELKSRGVILMDLDSAVREYPNLVSEYFMTRCVPVNSTKYTALHAAFWSGGVFLYIPKGVEIEDPILAQFWIDEPLSATFPHTLIIADDLSSVRYVEEHNSAYEGEQPSLLDGVVEVYVKNAAHVEFSNMQDLGQNVWTISNKNAVHEKDGSTTWVLADLGSKAMLSNVGVGLLGDGSAGELVGVFFTDHDQRYAINTLSNHAAIATNAETLVKGVLTDEARVEFDGMIRVQPKAQQTASFLSDHTLLLSDKCRAESIPGLEIGANEVSASHGATTGKIDEEQLFYLMVRGIPREEAERIIVQGFFEPVLQRIPLENLRNRLRRSIVRRMRGAYEGEADTWVDAQERWEVEGVDEYAVSLDEKPDEEIRLTEY